MKNYNMPPDGIFFQAVLYEGTKIALDKNG